MRRRLSLACRDRSAVAAEKAASERVVGALAAEVDGFGGERIERALQGFGIAPGVVREQPGGDERCGI